MSPGNRMPLIKGEIPVVQENISMFPADTPAKLCRSVSLILWFTVLDVDGFFSSEVLIQLRKFNKDQVKV